MAYIRYCINVKAWDVIIHPCVIFNAGLVKYVMKLRRVLSIMFDIKNGCDSLSMSIDFGNINQQQLDKLALNICNGGVTTSDFRTSTYWYLVLSSETLFRRWCKWFWANMYVDNSLTSDSTAISYTAGRKSHHHIHNLLPKHYEFLFHLYLTYQFCPCA